MTSSQVERDRNVLLTAIKEATAALPPDAQGWLALKPIIGRTKGLTSRNRNDLIKELVDGGMLESRLRMRGVSNRGPGGIEYRLT